MEQKHAKRHIRILVKAFPQHSVKYEETVCCAGVPEEGNQFLRLFPIRYRRLPKEQRFNRYDLVEMTVTKASGDPRPESYRVDEGSIRIVARGHGLPDEQKVRVWLPFVSPSLSALMEENKRTNRSLGIIRPDSGPKVLMSLAGKMAAADKRIADLVFQQQRSFLEEPLKPLAPPKFSFSYEFKSAGRKHRHQIHDWEVQAAYFNYLRRYGSEERALSKLEAEYQENIPSRNLHFIMGTMKMHPKTFTLIGLLRTGADIDAIARQGDLVLS